MRSTTLLHLALHQVEELVVQLSEAFRRQRPAVRALEVLQHPLSRARSTKPMPCSSLYRFSFATRRSRLLTSSTSAESRSEISRRMSLTNGSVVSETLMTPPLQLRRHR